MASLTIRNLSDLTKQNLRVRAATHGRSMEAEARRILDDAVNRPTPRRTPMTEGPSAHGMDAVEPFDQKAEPDRSPGEMPASHRAPGREKPSLDELMKLSVRPDTQVDIQAAQDELYDYLYDDDRR